MGEKLRISATATAQGLTQIQVEFEGKQQSFECTQSPCNAAFEIVPQKKGILFAQVNAMHSGGVISKKITLRVVSTQLTCIDSTDFLECSNEKPFFCSAGELVPDCEKCGCPGSTQCVQNSCVPSSTGLELTGLKQEKIFITPGSVPSFAVFANAVDEKVLAGAQFSLHAYLYSADKNFFAEKNFSLENDLPHGSAKEIEITFAQGLPEGTYLLRAELFGDEKLSEKTFENALTVRQADEVSPLAPVWIGWSMEGNQVKLSWVQNPEDDVKDYVVLQSSEETAGYIAYSRLEAVPAKQTSFLIDTPLTGNFFMLRAVDWYGNESEYSEVLQVNG
ncbi:MAG: hypothetical protein AAB558_03045 [Patescibacteria group bacterium]